MQYKSFEIAAIHNDGKFIILNEGTDLDSIPDDVRKDFPFIFRLAGDDFYGWDEKGERVKDMEYVTDYGMSKYDPKDSYEDEYAMPLYEYGMGMNGDTIIEYLVDDEWQDCAVG